MTRPPLGKSAGSQSMCSRPSTTKLASKGGAPAEVDVVLPVNFTDVRFTMAYLFPKYRAGVFVFPYQRLCLGPLMGRRGPQISKQNGSCEGVPSIRTPKWAIPYKRFK